MVMVCARVASNPDLSVACTVKSKVPVFVGVPVIAPEEARVKPGGRVPDTTFQVNGVTSMTLPSASRFFPLSTVGAGAE